MTLLNYEVRTALVNLFGNYQQVYPQEQHHKLCAWSGCYLTGPHTD